MATYKYRQLTLSYMSRLSSVSKGLHRVESCFAAYPRSDEDQICSRLVFTWNLKADSEERHITKLHTIFLFSDMKLIARCSVFYGNFTFRHVSRCDQGAFEQREKLIHDQI
jgi:hypothetical protein